MNLNDLLNEKQISQYHRDWSQYSNKYLEEYKHIVHSSVPLIGKTMKFNQYPVYRSHIFKKRLQKLFDPYFASKGYFHPLLHTTHYLILLEQIGHAAFTKEIPKYYQYRLKERFKPRKPPEMKKSVEIDKSQTSIEVIPKVIYRNERLFFDVSLTFYNDKDNDILQKWYFDGVGEKREYVKCLENYKQNPNGENLGKLIMKIQNRSLSNKRLINQRSIFAKKESIINNLVVGRIIEREIHDFFAIWGRDE